MVQIYPQYEKYYQTYTNADEIFNEIDSVIFSGINRLEAFLIDDDNIIAIRNFDSSNAFITNYGDIVRQLVEDEIWFYGQYCKPELLVESFNKMYGNIFQQYKNSNEDGFDIFVRMIDGIKADHKNSKLHSNLLECLYECVNVRNSMFPDNQIPYKRFKTLGLLKLNDDDAWVTSSCLSYSKELEQKINNVPIK